MEYQEILFMAVMAIIMMFSSIIFAFVQRRWSPSSHGDSPQQGEKSVILPPFWTTRPAAWFIFVESKFREKNIISQRRRFDFLLAALPERVLDQVMDVVDNISEDFPYDVLKSRLLETHTLSDHEKLEVLYKSEHLGGRKPSQMLASMLAYCPTGMEQTIMFQFMFLQRLPVTLRTLLGEQEPGDIRSLAARADRLWATHRPQGHDLVAQVGTAEEQPAQVAAVQRKEPFKKQPWSRPAGKKPWGHRQAAGGQTARASGPGSARISHSEQARVTSGSGLCFYHWTHGPNARECVAPCSWAGN
jgi:hypothetical protein